MAASVFARVVSYYKEERQRLSKLYHKHLTLSESVTIEELEKALSLAYFLSYSQGIWLIHEASKTFNYGIDLLEVLRIWKGGCIIRSKMLDFLIELLKDSQDNLTFLNDEKAQKFVEERLDSAVKVSNFARSLAIPSPAINGCLDYLFSLTTDSLPANLIQAQRDFFGAHTFERIDKPGTFHVEWQPLD
ncbi:MAG: NADP-dependent phosphogluconate dehydrogenase, partial [Pseudothermotoga sp.]|nr:NADP-dependent phosphogluconate dehydrogenase [Pseudothermotoga sp.]